MISIFNNTQVTQAVLQLYRRINSQYALLITEFSSELGEGWGWITWFGTDGQIKVNKVFRLLLQNHNTVAVSGITTSNYSCDMQKTRDESDHSGLRKLKKNCQKILPVFGRFLCLGWAGWFLVFCIFSGSLRHIFNHTILTWNFCLARKFFDQ